jgi:hypothetical protein
MMTRIVVCVLLFLYQTLVVCADAVRSVKNGQELQAAFSDGTKHILITEHLDLTSLNVYDGVGLDDGVLASTGKTLTLQVRCHDDQGRTLARWHASSVPQKSFTCHSPEKKISLHWFKRARGSWRSDSTF